MLKVRAGKAALTEWTQPMQCSRDNVCVKVATFVLALLWLISPKGGSCQSSEEQVERSFHAGRRDLQDGNFARAVEEFKKVLTLDPTLLEAEVNLGLAYQSLFEYDLAVRHLAKALHERPNLLGATVIAGMDYLKLGSPEKAIPFLQQAVKLDPSSGEARKALASAYLVQENFRLAAAHVRNFSLVNAECVQVTIRTMEKSTWSGPKLRAGLYEVHA